MVEEQRIIGSEESSELLARVAAALEHQTAEQARMHTQSLELSRRNLELTEANHLAWLRSLELQEAAAKRYENRLAEQKRQQPWALGILALMVMALLALLLLAHHTR